MKQVLILILYIFVQFAFLSSTCVPSWQQCGCSHQKSVLCETRIVGGCTAQKHSWPWVVSIRRTDAHRTPPGSGIAICGGTLINQNYVLTAAHCFYNDTRMPLANYFVVVAAHYVNDTNPIRINIQSITLHEKYDHNLYLNDIALLKLSCKVNFNYSHTGFICLPPSNSASYPYEGNYGVAVGWGSLEENGPLAYELQQIRLPIISNKHKYCYAQVADENIQFCAGSLSGGRDTCQGYFSGGPLMVFDGNTSTWHIAGITSYGYGCARAKYPGVYTRVSMFTDWINEKMSSSSNSLRIYVFIQLFMLMFDFVFLRQQ